MVTDVKMPNGTGFDLLLGIKKYSIPIEKIIIMTGYSDIQESEFKDKGAHYFFNKPLDLFKITEILTGKSLLKDQGSST